MTNHNTSKPPSYTGLITLGAVVLGSYQLKKENWVKNPEIKTPDDDSNSKPYDPFSNPYPNLPPINWNLYSNLFSGGPTENMESTYQEILLDRYHPSGKHQEIRRRFLKDCLQFVHLTNPKIPDGTPPPGTPQQYRMDAGVTINMVCEDLKKLLEQLDGGMLPVPFWVGWRAGKDLLDGEFPEKVEEPSSERDHLWNALVDALDYARLPNIADESTGIEQYNKLLQILKDLKNDLCPPDANPAYTQKFLKEMKEHTRDENWGKPMWSIIIKTPTGYSETFRPVPFYTSNSQGSD